MVTMSDATPADRRDAGVTVRTALVGEIDAVRKQLASGTRRSGCQWVGAGARAIPQARDYAVLPALSCGRYSRRPRQARPSFPRRRVFCRSRPPARPTQSGSSLPARRLSRRSRAIAPPG